MSDEDDIPSRANVPKLSNHTANQRKNGDDDLYPDVERIRKLVDPDDADVRPEQISNLSQYPEFQREEPDIAKEHIAFLDNAINLAAPPDLFGNQKNANAWFNLQSSASRDKLAEIQFWVVDNQDHTLKVEIGTKNKKVMALIKDRYNDDDVFKEFQRDIRGASSGL
jgi:hypothetical protein